ncbi:putative agnoprotein 1 [possum polyomavirus]|nr:putative agnoprotein 1 [possum polyomavirus]
MAGSPGSWRRARFTFRNLRKETTRKQYLIPRSPRVIHFSGSLPRTQCSRGHPQNRRKCGLQAK